MITHIDIENIAVIEKASVDFEKGFNAISGETGAGKSLLINSIGIILGLRTPRELIREGAPFLKVSASFFDKNIDSVLEDFDIFSDDGNILINRKIYPDGRNICQVNGESVSVSTLKAIGEKLVTSHGQRDSAEIFNTSSHVKFLDSFSGNGELFEKYTSEYSEYKLLKKELESISMSEESRKNEIDYLKYQTEEIKNAHLSSEEEDELISRRNVLNNAETLKKSANALYNALFSDGAARDLLYSAKREAESISSFDERGATFSDKIQSIYYDIDELSRDISSYRDSIEFSPSALEEINDRLSLISNLKRKYNKSVSDILNFYDEATARLSFLLNCEENLGALEEKVNGLEKRALETAKELSRVRRENALILSEKLSKELEDLDMPRCKVEFSFETCPLSPLGMDNVEILISTNPQDAPKPLTKIASGGEISRVMLAIKSVFSDFYSSSTLVFDEIDTGVSGRAAEKIAHKMSELSKHFQLISITHLPIIAAAADNHILVEKNTESDLFKSEIKTLDEKSREIEIARIISGDKINDTAIENARDLLGFFNERRNKN